MQTLRAKIFLGFLVVLLAFGGATAYGAWAVHTLGEKLRLVALGYSALRLDIQDQQAILSSIRLRLPQAYTEAGGGAATALAADRKLRQVRLTVARDRLAELSRSLPRADARFLQDLDGRLIQLGRLYEESEAALQVVLQQGETAPLELGHFKEKEEAAERLLQEQGGALYTKVIEAGAVGERYEARAVWMMAVLSVLAGAVGVVVLLLMQAALFPLRRLSESAREIARGNYRQRVPGNTQDEVGALAREFNAMAAALEERETRLRRSEQLAAVGKMVAQISHEVRNPLSSIGLNAELLADEVASAGSEAQTLARAIVKEVDRLTEVTEQYLRFARLPEARFTKGDPSRVVRSLLTFVAGDLSGRGVQVEARLAEDLPQIPLDENQLRPALLNLVRNAAEAMAELPPSARHLLVRTSLRKGTQPAVAIDVIDSGPGISAENLTHVFEPFFTTKKGGTGLGLALTQEVVVRHGGTLEVECPQQGGTRFSLVLPVA